MFRRAWRRFLRLGCRACIRGPLLRRRHGTGTSLVPRFECYDASTSRALSRWMGDELVTQVRAYLAEHDPDVLAAVEDVDRSLIQLELQRSPLERLVTSLQQARFYERLAASRQTAEGGSR